MTDANQNGQYSYFWFVFSFDRSVNHLTTRSHFDLTLLEQSNPEKRRSIRVIIIIIDVALSVYALSGDTYCNVKCVLIWAMAHHWLNNSVLLHHSVRWKTMRFNFHLTSVCNDLLLVIFSAIVLHLMVFILLGDICFRCCCCCWYRIVRACSG